MNSQKMKEGFVKLLEETKVLTTSELAKHFSLSWNTAEKYMLELTLDGRVIRMKKAGVNLWVAK